MKSFVFLFLFFSFNASNAVELSPLSHIDKDLSNLLSSSSSRKSFSEMRKIADDKNSDVSIAFENYIIAKRKVAIARLQFNPLTTGHFLGIALGLPYLWTPLAIEAVLSIPTKIYNVSKNNYLKKVAMYNLYDARSALNNELAHLYYDIITHEVILKSIDMETEILTYQLSKINDPKVSEIKIDRIKKWIISLGLERSDIYNLYVSELSALRTLITTTNENFFELQQFSKLLTKDFLKDLDQFKIQDFSLINSDKYKASINLELASKANIKQVDWSILSWSGLNFSYVKRIKTAKNEASVARLRKDSTKLEVKTRVLMELEKLDSSIDILTNYNSISNESIQIYSDTYKSFLLGQLNEDAVVDTSIAAIRDFRSKVVAHYSSWSALSDFSASANYDFVNRSIQSNDSAQSQLESIPDSIFNSFDFKINKHFVEDSYVLYLTSKKISSVSKIDYYFDDQTVGLKSADDGTNNYAIAIPSSEISRVFSGRAVVRLDNGDEYQIKFNL